MIARKDERCAFDAGMKMHLRSLLPPLANSSVLRGLIYCSFSFREDGTLLDQGAHRWPDNEAYSIELRADCVLGVVGDVRIEFSYAPAVLPDLEEVLEIAKNLDGLDPRFGAAPCSPSDETTTGAGTHGDQLTAKAPLRS